MIDFKKFLESYKIEFDPYIHTFITLHGKNDKDEPEDRVIMIVKNPAKMKKKKGEKDGEKSPKQLELPITPKEKKEDKPAKSDAPLKKEPVLTGTDLYNTIFDSNKLILANPPKEFKTIQECEDYMNKISPNVYCGFKGMDIDICNGYIKKYYNFVKKYPLISDLMRNFASFDGAKEVSVREANKLLDSSGKIHDEFVKKLNSRIEFFGESFIDTGNYTLNQLQSMADVFSTDKKFNDFLKKYNLTGHELIRDIKKTAPKVVEKFQKEYNNNVTKNIRNEFVKSLKQNFLPPIMKKGKNTYAFTSSSIGGIKSGGVIFCKNGKEIEKSYERDVSTGFHPVGTDFSSIATHELGHALDRVLGCKYSNEIQSLYFSSDVGKELSRYGNHSVAEFIAEAMAEYLDSDNPRTLSKIIGNKVDRMYEDLVKGYYENYQKTGRKLWV